MHLSKSKNKLSHNTEPFFFSYEAMGTWWKITFWSDHTFEQKKDLQKQIIQQTQQFDSLYSRFIPKSYILKEFSQPGIKKIPIELYEILSLYDRFFEASEKKITPLIGQAMIDIGYDADYSFKPQKISNVPDFRRVIKFTKPDTIVLSESIILDIGALGKGFFVDQVMSYLKGNKCSRIIVDGSGDIAFFSEKTNDVITVGLEHPHNNSKIIGRIALKNGTSICSSGINRRSWGDFNHIIDPFTKISPQDVLATWVIAESTAIADGLATSLFLTSAEKLKHYFNFEYALLRKNMFLERSTGFQVELY